MDFPGLPALHLLCPWGVGRTASDGRAASEGGYRTDPRTVRPLYAGHPRRPSAKGRSGTGEGELFGVPGGRGLSRRPGASVRPGGAGEPVEGGRRSRKGTVLGRAGPRPSTRTRVVA